MVGPPRSGDRHARGPARGGVRDAAGRGPCAGVGGWRHGLARFAAEFGEAFLPTRCLGCGRAGAGGGGAVVCPRCRTRLPELPRPRCPRCHHPALVAGAACPFCADWPALVAAARSVTPFTEPGRELVHALKYQGWTSVADWMGERMARLVALETDVVRREGPAGEGGAPAGPIAVVPVPTTPARLRERGFNPAALLARGLAAYLRVSLVETLRRPREAPRQVGLQPAERAANVRDAFVLDGARIGSLQQTHVLLVDDVLTTGATALEAARALAGCGVRRVTLVTFARALPTGPDADEFRP
ncbi:MAG: ComF family protein [Longimicrobiales bacterium]|nr:ComF family protein [Longimicrobiales bacterium]